MQHIKSHLFSIYFYKEMQHIKSHLFSIYFYKIPVISSPR